MTRWIARLLTPKGPIALGRFRGPDDVKIARSIAFNRWVKGSGLPRGHVDVKPDVQTFWQAIMESDF